MDSSRREIVTHTLRKQAAHSFTSLKSFPFLSNFCVPPALKILLFLLLCVVLSLPAVAEPPLYAEKCPVEGDRFEELRQRVPALQHERGERLPMIMWKCVGYKPRPPEVYRKLLARGLTQHIRMDPGMIETAKALQKAGSPVIMMQGKGGQWPYKLAGKRELWKHRYEEGYKPRNGGKHGACISVVKGWRKAASKVREILHKYKKNDITVNAVWMDWEGAWPETWKEVPGKEAYRNARHCKRCRRRLPSRALTNAQAFYEFAGRQFFSRLGTYLATPAREVFPNVSTTDWMLVYSSSTTPVWHPWWQKKIPPVVPHTFTAMNPVAYGNTKFYDVAWSDKFPKDREHVDQFYTHQLLRNISGNAANRKKFAPEKNCYPWVARWCPDVGDPDIPILSRPRYREILRHIWLRGADGMQIFNPFRDGYEAMAYKEVVDAVRVYDEMLAYREFLDEGEVMCTDVPDLQGQGIIWSGLRLQGRAVVRVFRPGGAPPSVTIHPWKGTTVTLGDLPETNGGTWILKRTADDRINARRANSSEN